MSSNLPSPCGLSSLDINQIRALTADVIMALHERGPKVVGRVLEMTDEKAATMMWTGLWDETRPADPTVRINTAMSAMPNEALIKLAPAVLLEAFKRWPESYEGLGGLGDEVRVSVVSMIDGWSEKTAA